MLMTWWDLNKQNIRKLIDSAMGLVAGWLIAQGDWGALVAPAVGLAVNYAWFWIDNRNKVTVKGLEAADMTGAAIAVAAAVDAAKKPSK